MGIVMITDYDYSWISRPIKQKFSNLVGRFRKNSDPSPDSEDDGLMGQYFYGLGYGAASAGCTAPVFIALLMASMKYTIFGALVIFGLYAASTAVLMITFTLLVAASQETIVDKMKASTGVIKKVGGSVLILVGVYLVYEYFTTWI
jgi:cytochrome c-type biogenesis protein